VLTTVTIFSRTESFDGLWPSLRETIMYSKAGKLLVAETDVL
jgi:hypothetical protein